MRSDPLIGSGGMGEVYLSPGYPAEQERRDQTLANEFRFLTPRPNVVSFAKRAAAFTRASKYFARSTRSPEADEYSFYRDAVRRQELPLRTFSAARRPGIASSLDIARPDSGWPRRSMRRA